MKMISNFLIDNEIPFHYYPSNPDPKKKVMSIKVPVVEKRFQKDLSGLIKKQDLAAQENGVGLLISEKQKK